MKRQPLPRVREDPPMRNVSHTRQESPGFSRGEEVKVIQNLWADRVGKARLDIRSAPEVVMRAIERSKRGHELFGRVREAPELVVYELKTLI